MPVFLGFVLVLNKTNVYCVWRGREGERAWDWWYDYLILFNYCKEDRINNNNNILAWKYTKNKKREKLVIDLIPEIWFEKKIVISLYKKYEKELRVFKKEKALASATGIFAYLTAASALSLHVCMFACLCVLWVSFYGF